jgi:hypothetical protein
MNICNSVHRSFPLASIRSRISPVHALQTDLHNINFNIILPNMPRSCKWSLSVGFPHQNPVCTSHLHLGEIMSQINKWFQTTAVCVMRSRHILAANISVVLDLSPILILLGVPLVLSAHAVGVVKEPPRHKFGTKYFSWHVKLPTRSIHFVCFCFVLGISAARFCQ